MKAIIAIGAVVAIMVTMSLLGSNADTSSAGGDVVQAVQTVPEAKGHVNDYAEVLSPEMEARLEAHLKAYPHEIAVLTVKSLNGLSVEEFGIKVAEAWKVGDADKDDGVILIVATGDRKIRIEVGYGAEATLNDAKAGRIIRDQIAPSLKAGNWEEGIQKGVDGIISSFN